MTAPASDWGAIEQALQAWVALSSGIPAARVVWSGFGRARPTVAPGEQWISLLIDAVSLDSMPWGEVTPNPLTFAPLAVVASPAPASTFTVSNHGRATGDGPLRLTTTGALPTGSAVGANYWAVVVDANTLKLATHFADAMASVPVTIVLADAGTGVHTLSATAETVTAGAEVLQLVHVQQSAKLSVQCYGGNPTGNDNPKAILQRVVTSAQLPSFRDALEAANVGVTTSGAINDVGALINSARWEPRAHVDFTIWFTAQVQETGTVIETAEVALDVIDKAPIVFAVS